MTRIHGQQNDRIIIHAIDDFKVVMVRIDIADASGVLLEKGEALQKTKWCWEYSLTATYENIRGFRILAHAWDKPGNEAVREIVCN